MSRKGVHFTPASFYKKQTGEGTYIHATVHRHNALEAPAVCSGPSGRYGFRTRKATLSNVPSVSDVESTCTSYDDDTGDPTFELGNVENAVDSSDSDAPDKISEVDRWIKEHLMKTALKKRSHIPAECRKDTSTQQHKQKSAIQPQPIGTEGPPEEELRMCAEPKMQQKMTLEKEDSAIQPLPKGTEGPPEEELSLCAEPQMQQKMTLEKEDKTKPKPRYACPFCQKVFGAKLRRHLLSKQHDNEPQVIRLKLMCPEEREKEFILLKNKGRRMYNLKVLQGSVDGNIIVHQKTKDSNMTGQKLCTGCNGLFARRQFYRHKCVFGKVTQGFSLSDQVSADQALIRETISEIQDPSRRAFMRMDPTVHKVIHAYASSHNMTLKAKETLRGKLNLLARIVFTFREDNNMHEAQVKDLLRPSQFRNVVAVASKLARLTPDGKFGAPSNARSVGLLISECAQIVECSANEQGDLIGMEEAIRFQALYSKAWNSSIGGKAQLCIKDGQRDRVLELPLVHDISRLSDSLKTRIATLSKQLRQETTQATWRKLAECVLSYLILFNRRRITEVSTMTLRDYGKVKSSMDDADLDLGLSELEEKLLSTFYRVELRGKRHRPVPVLLKQDIKESLDLLVQTRDKADICEENKFIFALSRSSTGYIRGDKALKEAVQAVEPPLQHGERVKSTALRKHIATLSQILDMTAPEREALAAFMGHNMEVHNQYYKLPLRTLQAAKLGALFVSLDSGTISTQAGMPLNNMTVSIGGSSDSSDANGSSSSSDSESSCGQSSSSHSQEGAEADLPKSPSDSSEGAEADLPLSPPPDSSQGTRADPSQSPRSDSLQDPYTHPHPHATVEASAAVEGKKCDKRPWTKEENEAIQFHFGDLIKMGKTPNVEMIKTAYFHDARLAGRSIVQVRAKVANEKKRFHRHF